ncbi:uncharacterized protein LOC130453204 [Diorhabda sublineata]|uniref:uncharacterized protein LOC130453204 n=1 Tax=Diorhabda sublineata TaxID=1163346 RepID=UPI0024E053FD|nr:uncharacterized protein LOC130453204 [Diorhabda sublineata]
MIEREKVSSFFTRKCIGISFFILILVVVIFTWIMISKDNTSIRKTESTTQHTPTLSTCEINPLGTSLTPLLIKNNAIIYPQFSNGTVELSPFEVLEFSCPSGNVIANGVTFNTTVKAACHHDDYFNISGITFQWKTISCSKTLTPTIKEASINDLPDNDFNEICYDDSLKLGLIGFDLDPDRFVNIVSVCFNTTSRVALYSNHVLTSSISIFVTNSDFKQDDTFYKMGASINTIYTNSQSTINRILGLEENSIEYINDDIYINRGHLAPRADFYYPCIQSAVQRYINVAPQWNTFNGGNWQQAEKDVRIYARDNNVDLQIWTGTYGNSMLEEQKLYLYTYKDSPVLPVPELFWKIVYNPVNATGIILIGHNNPYHDNSTLKDEIICQDVSRNVEWLHWDSGNIEKGYSYACDYNDEKFHNLVEFVPKLNVKDCSIDPFITNAPIFIHPETTELIYPEHGQNTLAFTTSSVIELACPSGEVTVDGVSKGTVVIAVCAGDDKFNVDGDTVTWDRIICSKEITPTVVDVTDVAHDYDVHNQCFDTEGNLKIIQIGFTLDTNRFLNFIDICFSTVTKIAAYSYFVIPASINSRAKGVVSPSFKQDDIFYKMGKSVNQFYKDSQSTINGILGLPSTSEEYINTSTFINRGHLAAKADFVYEPFQKGTYRYINVGPQWSTFNAGNWNQMETDLRNYADANKLDLQIWCGVYGISELPNDQDSELEKLYLYVDETDSKNSPSFPVSEVFWRVVYSPANQKAVILIGHNNPYESEVEILCTTDLTDSIAWLKWNRTNIRKGFSYACDYNDDKFRALVPVIPKLYVNGCIINPFRTGAPFLIDTNTATFIYPQPEKSIVEISLDDYIEFSCPGKDIMRDGVSLGSLVSARCSKENIFNIDGTDTSWDNLQCSTEPVPIVRELKTYELDGDNPNVNCFNGKENILKLLQIGFPLNDEVFIGIVEVCFNVKDKVPVYSHFTISASINSRERNVQNPFFEQDNNLYRIGNNIHYIFKNGKMTVNNLLGLPYDSEKYFKTHIFINKGHLAAKADFIYEPLQKATFRYINVSPQWSSFNGGNWNQVEIDVRDYAARKKLDLEVWTGIYGNSILKHEETLEPRKLYLNYQNKDSPTFPVPAVFWKLVYDSQNKKGIILVGHNNPYESITGENQMVCDIDVSNQVKWLRWSKNNLVKGYSYACDWNDKKFRTLIDVLPPIHVNGLLD